MEFIIAILMLLTNAELEPSAPIPQTPPIDNARPLYLVINYTEPQFSAGENWYIFNAYENGIYSSVAWLDCCSQSVISVATPGYDEDIYDEAYFQKLMAHYIPFETTATCEYESIKLYEHEAFNNEGMPQLSRYWVDSTDFNQVMRIHFVFPVGKEDLLDKYANIFFPMLPTCEDDD